MVRWYGHVRRMNEDRLPNFRDENRRKIKAREKTEDSDGKILPKSYHNPSLIDNNHRLKMPGQETCLYGSCYHTGVTHVTTTVQTRTTDQSILLASVYVSEGRNIVNQLTMKVMEVQLAKLTEHGSKEE
uniref:Uncharacterized protein n=1 Tax=Cacopsylla melanoneura TaxID=428564 RepID=A0A8D8Z820_9HEMI